MLRQLDKPEYWFNPPQVLRRTSFAIRALRNTLGEKVQVMLPWGAQLIVDPREAIGYSICTAGVYDLALTEALFRLIDPGETCVDVGANIGHMTTVMAHCAGASGSVTSFEPFPPVYAQLAENLAGTSNVRLEQMAVSSFDGMALLKAPDGFASNQGTATLCSSGEGNTVSVKTIRLDDYLAGQTVAVVKIDVEGHELEVLEGSRKMLNGAIRDIVFEEHGGYPAETHGLLERSGYTLYRIERTLLRPILLPPHSAPLHVNAAANYLATRSPERAMDRFSRPGWSALNHRV